MDDAVHQFRKKIHGMSVLELNAVSEIIKQRSRDFIEEMYAMAEGIASHRAALFGEKLPGVMSPIAHE